MCTVRCSYCNSVLNPFIYAYYNKDFKRSFVRVLKCVFFCTCSSAHAETTRERDRRGSPAAIQYTPPPKISVRLRRSTQSALIASAGRVH